MQTYTDEQLIKNYLKGDDNSLEILIRRYLKPIYFFVYGYTKDEQKAEDIAQEVFVKIWKNLKKFDKNKNFKTWIFTIAKNTALDYLKKKKELPFSNFDIEDGKNFLAETVANKNLLPDKLAEKSFTKDWLYVAIDKLSAKYSLVLKLYYKEYLNFREISELLGESLNTVKSRHRRGLILLRATLNNN